MVPENRMGFLRDNGDGLAQNVWIDLRYIVAVHTHTALGGIIKTGDQIDERRFSGTGGTDDA